MDTTKRYLMICNRYKGLAYVAGSSNDSEEIKKNILEIFLRTPRIEDVIVIDTENNIYDIFK